MCSTYIYIRTYARTDIYTDININVYAHACLVKTSCPEPADSLATSICSPCCWVALPPVWGTWASPTQKDTAAQNYHNEGKITYYNTCTCTCTCNIVLLSCYVHVHVYNIRRCTYITRLMQHKHNYCHTEMPLQLLVYVHLDFGRGLQYWHNTSWMCKV